MTAKIFDIFTGQEIKGPSAEQLRKRSAKLPTATGMSRRAEENSFTNAGLIAFRDVLPKIRRRMPR